MLVPRLSNKKQNEEMRSHVSFFSYLNMSLIVWRARVCLYECNTSVLHLCNEVNLTSSCHMPGSQRLTVIFTHFPPTSRGRVGDLAAANRALDLFVSRRCILWCCEAKSSEYYDQCLSMRISIVPGSWFWPRMLMRSQSFIVVPRCWRVPILESLFRSRTLMYYKH